MTCSYQFNNTDNNFEELDHIFNPCLTFNSVHFCLYDKIISFRNGIIN